jgi:tRNA pseudouridine55 synthase
LTPKKSIDRLFVAYKPAGISSNRFLSQIKRRYNVKKAGFSGTLDPFAKGVLIIAFGKYTKLFQFLKKTPKTYHATLWLGAYSETLDIEKVSHIEEVLPFQEARILNELDSLIGDITYLPPKYSAKKVDGKRAYDLARSGEDVKLKTITSHVYDTKLISYKHPFVTFEITISEGGYIRSMGEILCDKLKVPGCLSALKRVREGDFIYKNEIALNPLEFLDLEENFYLNDKNNILLGKKLSISDFKIQKNGKYFIKLDKIISILQIKDDKVDYLLNGVNISC